MDPLRNLPTSDRIQILVRQADAARSIYIGELIGEGLIAASNGLKAVGGWIRRAVPHVLHPS